MHLNLETGKYFQDRIVPSQTQLAGWSALVQALGIHTPVRQPTCISDRHIGGNRREKEGFTIFDRRYKIGDHLVNHLVFALRHENIDLLVLKRIFDTVPKSVLEEFIRANPTGVHARRIWFYFELLTGQILDMDDAPNVTAVDALDIRAYYTGKAKLSKRHKVRDNLLGNGDWCPIIRRTALLESFSAKGLAERASEMVGHTSRHILTRAASFLLLADSQASFQIEGERAPRNRLERWGKEVLKAGKNELTMEEILRLHGALMRDMRFVRPGFRTDGVFLGERDYRDDPLPEFIGANPEDLEALCTGMLATNKRMRSDGIDPVLQAAGTAFGFIYIHPFQDGNGRVHRCLIHHVLADRKYMPLGTVFPVSSVMLDRIDDYRRILQAHSAPLMDFIEWHPTSKQNVGVLNDTADLYRYFDCTEEAEFLYSCVERTVDHYLPVQIDYLRRHDEAMAGIIEMVDMPDRLAQNLILLIRQNDGTLSRRKREKSFSALTDNEVQKLETIVNAAFEGFQGTTIRS